MNLEQLRRYTRWHQHSNARQYVAPADPWAMRPVDSARIRCYNGEIQLNWGLGRVEGGDWDREEYREPLHETTTYRGLVQRFDEGRDWESTAIYRRAESRFQAGERVRGYESLAEFRKVRCAYLDELYADMAGAGYRPNSVSGHDSPASGSSFEDAAVHHLEPLVVVGRNGSIQLTEGFHRVVLASILDIDSIPVQVLCRHVGWQAVRDRVGATAGSEPPEGPEEFQNHPDLQDLL